MTPASSSKFSDRPAASVLFAMFLIAMSVLMCEVALTKVFSVQLWFHFGYLIISLALLGLGAAGSFLAVARLDRRPDQGHRFATRAAVGLSVAIAVAFAMVTKMRLDPLEMFESKSNIVVFILNICILIVPFFLAGLCQGWMITRYRNTIGTLYAFDLVGAGMGSALAMLGINRFGAPATVVLAALLAATGALLLSRSTARESRMPLWRASIAPIIMLLLFVEMTRVTPWRDLKSGRLRLGQKQTWQIMVPRSKELYRQQEDHVVFSRWNAIARIDVTDPVEAVPMFGAGVSNMFKQPGDPMYWLRILTQDGTAPSIAWQIKERENFRRELPFLRGTTQSFAYQLFDRPSVCAIGVGGGPDVLVALYHDAATITGVELNPLMLDVVTKDSPDGFADYVDHVFDDERITFVRNEGRHFLASSEDSFDIIQMSGVDTYAALASGAYVLAENYLYTSEAIRDIYNHLNPNGIWTVSRFLFKPPRETLRLAITAHDELEAIGVENPERHLMVWHDGDQLWATILMKKSPFTEEEVDRLKRFGEHYGFGVLYDPFGSGDNAFYDYFGHSAEERSAFIDDYYYNVAPTDDNSPFFFQWYKLKHALNVFSALPDSSGGYTTTTTPLGHRLLLISLLALVVLSSLLILYPLRRLDGDPLRDVQRKWAWLLYFACLGFAFIFAEVVFIQKFIVYLGAPLYSMALVLGGLLVASGVGSRLSSMFKGSGVMAARAVVPVVAVLLVVDWVAIQFALPATMRHDLPVKVLVSIGLLFPLGVVMGMPFPLGIRGVSALDARLIPWVWGVNACASVVGTVLCVFLSMLFGFQAVIGLAVGVYLSAFAFTLAVPRPDRSSTS